MSTARSRVSGLGVDPDQRVILQGTDWWQCETFLAIRGDSAGVRVTYLEGQLEIISPSRGHEMLETLFERLTRIVSLLEREVAGLRPAAQKAAETALLQCSFCNQGKTEVKRLITDKSGGGSAGGW